MIAADATLSHLHAAILADPADDLVRLVYADRLEEQGESERAEFIRAQIRIADSGDGPLLSWMQDKVREEICGSGDVWWTAWTFRRGFLASIECDLADWLHHGPALVREHPLERVAIRDREPLALSGGGPNDPWHGWCAWCDESLVLLGFEDDEPGPYKLPRWLFRLVKGKGIDSNPFDTYHDSLDAALTALSNACLAWARDSNRLEAGQ